ncbi:hypothetical protein EV210_111134 [Anaerospora hongkongensis]|uniref:Uncharacterized protein n=1 Tax=Anaerospora hongkongensis TaxID=244830 RepID=A0A4R1PX67_9FIRM|nr:hypothetical protein [Anaerospora hongkongensis]TCL35668.1 hypothetical protein EV210_111134 [Anaerospora hongkongensis]
MSEKICITFYSGTTLHKAAEEFCRIENAKPTTENTWTIDDAIKAAALIQLQEWNKKASAAE